MEWLGHEELSQHQSNKIAGTLDSLLILPSVLVQIPFKVAATHKLGTVIVLQRCKDKKADGNALIYVKTFELRKRMNLYQYLIQ